MTFVLRDKSQINCWEIKKKTQFFQKALPFYFFLAKFWWKNISPNVSVEREKF